MSAEFKGRREDFRLVTGQGRYTSDWNLPKQAYGYFLRSDRPHAKIKSIDTSAAESAPGVITVMTAKQTASIAPLPQMLAIPGTDGKKIIETGRDVLAGERVRFVGQSIAFVVAETLAQAMDAAELIEIDFEDLPFVVDGEEALEDGAPQLYDHIPNNRVYDFGYGNQEEADAAFSQADHVTKIVLDAPRIVGNPMEPKACVGAYDKKKDIYDVYMPTQGITLVRGGLAGALGVSEDQVKVHAWDVGGGFGVRSEAYAEYPVVMMASKIVGRPVKWVSTRQETMMSDHHARAAKLYGELALSKDGNAPVKPTKDAAMDGSYPLARALYLYTVGEPNANIKHFLAWAQSAEGQAIVEEMGYVPIEAVPMTDDAAPPDGDVKMLGSDTLVNVAQRWAEVYTGKYPNVNVQASGGGSGVGINQLIEGTIDIATASREMKDKERGKIAEKGLGDVVETTIGRDALAVYVNKGNPHDTISIKTLAEIFGEDGEITDWSQVGSE